MFNKCTELWREAHLEVKRPLLEVFFSLARHSVADNHNSYESQLLEVRMWFRMAGARDSAPCQKGAEREGYVAVSKQKGLLPALKSPFVCIYSLFFVDILHDLIYVFCRPCTSLFYLEMQTGLLWARKRQFVSPNTLHDIKPYWPFAVHT